MMKKELLRSGKHLFAKVLSTALAVTMLAGSAPATTAGQVHAADGAVIPKSGLIAEYSFAEKPADGKTVVNKATGAGAVGNAVVENVSTAKWEGKALVFSGQGASNNPVGTWVSLPDNILSQKTSATISIEVKPSASIITKNHFLWSIGNSGTGTYWFANTMDPRSSIKYGGKEKTAGASTKLMADRWYSLTAVIDAQKKTLTFYVDGVKAGEVQENNMSISQVDDQSRSTIGRAPFNDDLFQGSVSAFRVYDRALNADEVRDISDVDAAVHEGELQKTVEQMLEAIDLGDLSKVTRDLALPKTNGITWTTSDDAVIEKDGTIHPGDTSKKASLKAVLSFRGVTASRDFQVTVADRAEVAKTSVEDFLLPYVIDEPKLPMSYEGLNITWESSDISMIGNDGTVYAPETGLSEEVVLKAKFSASGFEGTKTFTSRVMGKDAQYLLSYTQQNPDEVMNSVYYMASMHLAFSTDGENYEPLNHNTGVLYPSIDISGKNFGKNRDGAAKGLADPYIFRLKDGGFGVIADRIDRIQAQADPIITDEAYKSSVLIYTSDHLVNYSEDYLLKLDPTGKKTVYDAICEWDSAAGKYRIVWRDEVGNWYKSYSADLKTAGEPEVTVRPDRQGDGTRLISGRKVFEGNSISLSSDEMKKVTDKLAPITNTTVEAPTIKVEEGAKITEEDLGRVTANYSDGSTAQKVVNWSESDLAKVDTGKPGTYEVSGDIKLTDYPFPMIKNRADPNVYQYNGKFYYISTQEPGFFPDGFQAPENTGRGDNIVFFVRESDTIIGLKDAKDHMIFKANKEGDMSGLLWAPEFHEVNGKLYIFFAAWQPGGDNYGVQARIMGLKEGKSPIDDDAWEVPHLVMRKDGVTQLTPPSARGDKSLDMTYFEQGGIHYVVYSAMDTRLNDYPASLYIASVDKEAPWKLTSDPVLISVPDKGWDVYRNAINEGPYVIQREGKIYLTFSGSAVGVDYCVGLLTADQDADLLNPKSWVKNNYPLLTRYSVPDQNGVPQMGPGHNCYVEDEDGFLTNIYHAMPNTIDRDTSARRVHFAKDGTPVLDMTIDQEVLPKNRKVKATIIVEPKSKDKISDIFTDVGENAWYVPYAQYVFDRGIMKGLDKTHFGPDVRLSRAQFATILYRMEGEPEAEYSPVFSDVPDEAFYTEAVMWASGEGVGVINGYENKTFGPSDLITREQMATMMLRYAAYKKYDTAKRSDFAGFPDKENVSAFAADGMSFAVAEGLITGDQNKLNPQGDTSRAVCATVIQRFLEAFEK